MHVERRTVLQAGGMIAIGGLVAACSSSSSSAQGSTAAEGTLAATAPATSAASGSAGSGSGSADAVASLTDVPVGGGVIIEDPAVVITQPAAGEVKAFTAICTHQGCLVGSVANNEIICPCHGSRFSALDGSVITGPAQAPLEAVGFNLEGDSIVLT